MTVIRTIPSYALGNQVSKQSVQSSVTFQSNPGYSQDVFVSSKNKKTSTKFGSESGSKTDLEILMDSLHFQKSVRKIVKDEIEASISKPSGSNSSSKPPRVPYRAGQEEIIKKYFSSKSQYEQMVREAMSMIESKQSYGKIFCDGKGMDFDKANHLKRVYAFIGTGRDINQPYEYVEDNGRKRSVTPLMWVTQFGTPDGVRALIKSGADIHKKSEYGGRHFDDGEMVKPITASMAWGKELTIEPLLEAGESPHGHMMKAVRHHNLDEIKVLLKYGGSPNDSNGEDISPLYVAMLFEEDFRYCPPYDKQAKDILEILKNAGATLTDTDRAQIANSERIEREVRNGNNNDCVVM